MAAGCTQVVTLQNFTCHLCVASPICPCAFPCPALFLQCTPQPVFPRNPISPDPVPLQILPLDHALGNAGISLTKAITLHCPRSPQDRRVFFTFWHQVRA